MCSLGLASRWPWRRLLATILSVAVALSSEAESTTVATPPVPCDTYPTSAGMTLDSSNTAVGSVVTATCVDPNQFYSFGISQKQFTCGSDGTWTPNVTAHCDVYYPPCPEMPLPNNTVRDSESRVSTVMVTYTCTDPNMFFDPDVTSLIAFCNSSGLWSPNPTPCRYIECEPVPPVNYAYASTAVTAHGTNVVYECVPGYSFDGESQLVWTIKCEGENPSVWVTVSPVNEILPPTCVPIVCPNVALPQYTLGFDNTDTTVGAAFNLWCWDGFTYGGSRIQTSSCQTSGAFGPVFSCQLVECPALTVTNATADILTRYYGDTVTYTCDGDLLFPGGEKTWTTYCNHQGLWDAMPPTSGCILGKCSPEFLLFNNSCFYISDPNQGQRLTSVVAQERCGYKRANLAYILNSEEQGFLGTRTFDVTGKDYWTGGFRDQQTKEWQWYGGVNVTFDGWLAGYPDPDYLQLNYTLCVRMTRGGFWKERDCDMVHPYVCRKGQVCSVVPTIENGFIRETVKSYYEVGESISFGCDAGYYFRSELLVNKTLYCRHGGFWDRIESCQPLTCPPLRRVPHAIPSSTADGLGTVVTYTCKTGYQWWDGTVGEKSVECVDGNPVPSWEGVVKYCKEITCPLPGIKHADYTHGRTKIGENDIYVCREGFYLAGFTPLKYNVSITCKADGTWDLWDLPISECSRFPCTEFVHSHATTPVPFQYVGLDLEVTCNKGYQFPDLTTKKSTSCLSNQTYSPPTLPPCYPMSCPPIPHIPNARPRPNIRTILSVVKLVCLPGFMYIDGQTEMAISCDIDTLQWTEPPSGCIPLNSTILPVGWDPVISKQAAIGWGIAGSLVFATLIVGTIVADAATLDGDFRRLVADLDQKEEERRRKDLDEYAESESEPEDEPPSRGFSRNWRQEEDAATTTFVEINDTGSMDY